MAALTWFVVAAALLGAGWLGVDSDGLLPAVLAALGMSILSAATAGMGLLAQLAMFAALTLALLPLLQGWSRRRQTRAIPPGGSSDRASVISGFTIKEGSGRVRWQGQSWAATNLEPDQPLQTGDAVVVMGREGHRLLVVGDKV
ncbi:MAG: NfeD family protein [Synechococcus sp.]|nr:NfeD family protein [Synechococcus sp.]